MPNDQQTTAGVTWCDEGVFVHLANAQGFCHDHSLARRAGLLHRALQLSCLG